MSHPVVRVPGNPLTSSLEALGLTRTDFERKYGLSKNYLLRISQGRASSLSDFVKGALLEEADIRGIDLPELDSAWDAWIKAHRKKQTLPLPTGEYKLSPWARLVLAVGGTSRMAAILAVPDVLVSRYLRLNCTEMPQPIREALEDMNYKYRNSLEKEMNKWLPKR